MGNKQPVVPVERIEKSILLLRGQKVMLDADLAVLYGVSVGRLNEAVNRNLERFPRDFMFPLTRQEVANLRSQFATSRSQQRAEKEVTNLMFHFGTSRWGGRRYTPRAFTEQGVAMLSSVLNSKRAVQVNIEIMRAFIRLRQILASHKELAQKLEQLERKVSSHDVHIQSLFEAIRQLMAPVEPSRRRIGFQEE